MHSLDCCSFSSARCPRVFGVLLADLFVPAMLDDSDYIHFQGVLPSPNRLQIRATHSHRMSQICNYDLYIDKKHLTMMFKMIIHFTRLYNVASACRDSPTESGNHLGPVAIPGHLFDPIFLIQHGQIQYDYNHNNRMIIPNIYPKMTQIWQIYVFKRGHYLNYPKNPPLARALVGTSLDLAIW